MNGGSASAINALYGGDFVICGEVEDLNGYYNGYRIYGSGLLRDSLIQGGTLVVSDGGIIRDCEITSRHTNVSIGSGGFAESVRYMGGGNYSPLPYFSVYEAGLAVSTYLFNAHMNVFSGGQVSGTVLDRYAYINLSGGLAVDTLANQNGTITIYSGGTALRTTNLMDQIFISDGGLGLETLLFGGSQTVLRGGLTSDTMLASRGTLIISNGGCATGAILSNGGRLIADHGGTAKDIHAVRDGAVLVESEGRVENVQIDAYNMMLVSGRGRAEDVSVLSGGEVYLQNGAVLGGRLRLADGAIVSAHVSATIDFDLAKADSTTALLDNLSAVSGAPVYTVTVSGDTGEGSYLLAGGAAKFAGTITVQDGTMKYGTLSVDDPLVYGWNTYTLHLNGQELVLLVERNVAEAWGRSPAAAYPSRDSM